MTMPSISTPFTVTLPSPQQLSCWHANKPSDQSKQWRHWADTDLHTFWKHVQSHFFYSHDGKRLHYYLAKQANTQAPWIVISPGRIEAALKYQELIFDFAAQGFSVAVIDHRGQGLSDRLTSQPQQGHIDKFQHYIQDFDLWLQQLKPFIGESPCHLFAHSMGGTIATLYLAECGLKQPAVSFCTAVLSAPMMDIYTDPLPSPLGKSLVRSVAWLDKAVQPSQPNYAPGMTDFNPLPFHDNQLTHSKQRYQWFLDLYRSHPHIQLGGPTWQWLNEAIKAMKSLPKAASSIQLPVLVLQATQDRIVKPEAQFKFASQLCHKKSSLVRIEGAFHEIFMEQDTIRHLALEHIFTWMQRCSAS